MTDDPKPSYADFVKSLILILLFESAGCTAANACRLAFSAHSTFGPIAAVAAFLIIAGAGVSNLGSICMAHFTAIDDEYKPFAQASFCLTLSQTVLVAAVVFSRGATTNAAIAAACLGIALLVYRFAPGKFPPDFMRM